MTISSANAISSPPILSTDTIHLQFFSAPPPINAIVLHHDDGKYDERKHDEKDQGNSNRNSSHIQSRSNGRAVSWSRSATEKCKDALAYMAGAASMGAIAFMSYDRNKDEQLIIKDGCTEISLISNSSKTPLIPCRNSSYITDECIDSLGLTPWTVSVNTLLASFPVLFWFTIKAVNACLRLKRMHTSRLDEKVRICSCLSTTLIQSIVAVALIAITGSLQDDRCDDFCNDNYTTAFCASDRTVACKRPCHLMPVFTSIAASFFMQVVLSTPCICAEYRISKSSRRS